MPEDLYNDGPGDGGGTPGAPPEESKGGARTAILPKSICPECKPGDTISCKVTRVNEHDIEVEPQGGGEQQEEEQPPEEESPPADEGGENGSPMRSMLED
jgi:hypothetical protein